MYMKSSISLYPNL